MAEPSFVFDMQMKMKTLKSMVPEFQHCLVPSKLVPKLFPYLLNIDPTNMAVDVRSFEEKQEKILELEQRDRKTAVKMLLDMVFERAEDGVSCFIDVLKQNEREYFIAPLESREMDTCRASNQYGAFLLRLVEGEIIEKLTGDELLCISQDLLKEGTIDALDLEAITNILQLSGRGKAAVQLFTAMRQCREDWPAKFFATLQQVQPALFLKIVIYDYEESTSKKDLSPDSQSKEASSDSESDQTEIKTIPGLLQEISYDDKESACKKDLMSVSESIETSSDSEFDQTEIKTITGLLQETISLKLYDNKENTSRKNLISDNKSKEASSDSESDQTEIKTITGLLQEIDNSTRVDDDDISDEDSAGVDAGTGVYTSGEFSDSEKQDVEESEKKQNAHPGDPEHPLELSLRAYQLELAAPALKGLNTIICAPTGSGKTRVALHIVQKHLEANGTARRKVVFLARTVPLVSQQHRNFQKYLPNYKSVLVTGESKKFNMQLHSLLPKYDIFVLTPKILENHLVPEKIPSLAAFSLLIFDECHHTRKEEPYNSLMKSYLKSKKDGEEHLPQIVGLTASIGVEKATTVTEAVQSILGIMGNLDVSCISDVKQNLQELQDTVPVPKEEFENLVSHGDEVSRKIENIMHQIEEMLKNSGSQLHDSEISKLLQNMPTNCGEQQYGQWAVNLRNQICLLKFDDSQKSKQQKSFAREVQVLCDCLIAYNVALDVHDLTRPPDVLDYLNNKFRKLSTDTESKVFGYFTVLRKMLMKHTNEENPNLKILAEIIKKHLKTEGEDSQIIIFVQRRATCHALCRWLNSSTEKDLKQLGAAAFTGMGAHQEDGGMTLPGQEEVIQRFRNGDVKLLVTTSVGEEGIDIPDCNLVIKYNHVGNEVTTVQTRGRSRKKGGRSILMAKPKFIKKEMLNKQRAKMMYEAIEQVKQMSLDSIEAAVHQVQKKIMESEEIKASVQGTKKMSKCKEPFFLECSGLCHKLRVKGEYVRTINKSHHVIIGHQYDEQVVLQSKEHRHIDDVIFTGSFKCKECKNHLGQIVNYKQAQFMSIGVKSWIVLSKDNDRRPIKRWKKVPYQIEELSPADIKMHQGKHDDGCVDGSNPEEGAIGGAGE